MKQRFDFNTAKREAVSNNTILSEVPNEELLTGSACNEATSLKNVYQRDKIKNEMKNY